MSVLLVCNIWLFTKAGMTSIPFMSLQQLQWNESISVVHHTLTSWQRFNVNVQNKKELQPKALKASWKIKEEKCSLISFVLFLSLSLCGQSSASIVRGDAYGCKQFVISKPLLQSHFHIESEFT